MLRDITMIFSVLVSVVSVGFGIYKNVEANNARGFAYEQTYRVLNAVEQANIGNAAKTSITDHALDALRTPPPVIDLSRSRADEPAQEACSAVRQESCRALGTELAATNARCARNDVQACADARGLKDRIVSESCIACYAP